MNKENTQFYASKDSILLLLFLGVLFFGAGLISGIRNITSDSGIFSILLYGPSLGFVLFVIYKKIKLPALEFGENIVIVRPTFFPSKTISPLTTYEAIVSSDYIGFRKDGKDITIDKGIFTDSDWVKIIATIKEKRFSKHIIPKEADRDYQEETVIKDSKNPWE